MMVDEIVKTYQHNLGGNAKCKMLYDGLIGDRTFNAILPPSKKEEGEHARMGQVFKCPNCGGNETELKNGKRICAYCHSEVTGQARDIEDVISVPAITSYEEN